MHDVLFKGMVDNYRATHVFSFILSLQPTLDKPYHDAAKS